MITIYKYPLAITDTQTVKIPSEHKILTAQMQAGALCMWVGVDTKTDSEDVEVKIIGTGNPINQDALDGFDYLTSVQDGSFVWHVFVPEDSK